MILGFSKYGRGESGEGPVSYLTDGAISSVGYVTGRSRRGVVRNPAPVILRGDPRVVRTLINRVPFRRRYTSGVLSFSEKEISPKIEKQIMNRFEEVAFSGLALTRYSILWVRHTDKAHHELHFVSPAIELETGKNLNLNPPRQSTREMFDTFRRLMNDEFNLSDPDDPSRTRLVRMPSYLLKGAPTREDIRKTISSYLEASFKAGRITNLEDVFGLLREAGFSITRIGEDYATVVGANGKRCRLKGLLFHRDFSPASREAAPTQLSPDQRTRLEARLAGLVEARAKFNLERFGPPDGGREVIQAPLPSSPKLQQETSNDGTGTSLKQHFGTTYERVRAAHCSVGATIEQFDRATRHRRHAATEFSCATHRACRANESLVRTTRTVSDNLNANLRCLQQQALTKAIYRKHGVLSSAVDPDLESALELERTPHA